MKIFFDFATIALFFVAYKAYGMYVAVATVMFLYTAMTAYQLAMKKPIEKVQWITLFLILVLGAATLIFRNEMIFKWKTTAVYCLFATSFLINHLRKGKTFTEHMLGDKLQLPGQIWRNLNASWIVYFMLLASSNLYVAYHYDTETWVKFKMFGIMGFTLVFVVGQVIFLSKHIQNE